MYIMYYLLIEMGAYVHYVRLTRNRDGGVCTLSITY